MEKGGGPDQPLTSMRDLLDNLVVAADGRPLGRVGDVQARWGEDGRLRLEALLFGPQTLAARVWWRLGAPARAMLRDRFERSVAMTEVCQVGDEIHLRSSADCYSVGRVERARLARALRVLSGPRW